MKTLNLKAKTRKSDKDKSADLRSQLKIPAVIYGREIKNEHLLLEQSDFVKLYQEAGSSTLVDLIIDDKEPRKVLIQDVQFDPVSDDAIHVDFYQVKMDEEIEAEVELKFIGTAPAVKDQGGVLVKNFDSLEIKCLPADLPSEVVVDVSTLATFDDVIKIKDLEISDKVEVMQESDSVITTVTPPRSEEELAELDKEVEEDVEAVEGVKEEEPEGEEGEGEEKESEEKPESEGGDDKEPAPEKDKE